MAAVQESRVEAGDLLRDCCSNTGRSWWSRSRCHRGVSETWSVSEYNVMAETSNTLEELKGLQGFWLEQLEACHCLQVKTADGTVLVGEESKVSFLDIIGGLDWKNVS